MTRPARTPVGNHLWAAAGTGSVCGLIVYGIGAPLSRALGLAMVVALVGFVLLRAVETEPVEWPDGPSGGSDRLAAIQRWRLNGFDAMTDRNPGVSPHLQLRLQSLASALLAKRRVVPGSAAAVALLGSTTHDLLYPVWDNQDDEHQVRTGPPDPTTGQLAEMVDRLIALSAERLPSSPSTVRPDASQSKGRP